MIFTTLISTSLLISLVECVIVRSRFPTSSRSLVEDYGRSGFLSRDSQAAAGYLLAGATDQRLIPGNPIDDKIAEILDRDGPDMRPSRDFKDYRDINLNVSKRAWELLHDRASDVVGQRIDVVKPAIDELLRSARVSGTCKNSIDNLFDRAKQLDSWAIKLLNSWSNFPPVELFEGTYSEMGSFSTCVNLPENKYINHTHFCSLTFRPILPSRVDYELVVQREEEDLLHLFQKSPYRNANDISDRDAFTDLLDHSQYHHYVYYKLGTCWPIGCSPYDIQAIARLVGRRNILMHGPVKCYSRFGDDYDQSFSEAKPISRPYGVHPKHNQESNNLTHSDSKLVISVWDVNRGIFIWKPYLNRAQRWSIAVIVVVSIVILCLTLIDLFLVRILRTLRTLIGLTQGVIVDNQSDEAVESIPIETNVSSSNEVNGDDAIGLKIQSQDVRAEANVFNVGTTTKSSPKKQLVRHETFYTQFLGLVDDFSIITNTSQFFRVTQNQMKNDILCLNGIRCITMIWIIMTHTMLYNDWSAFARTREIEKSLKSLITQPLFNGSYLVDTFFFMSGLLSAYTAFKHCHGLVSKFSSIAFIFGRWLRLTPQIFFVSLIYIMAPTLSTGPHWFPIVAEFSENCVDNWWINVLHIQSFYRKEKMCNFVTWWISIDFFYHFFAVAVIWIIMLTSHKVGFLSIIGITMSNVIYQAYTHWVRRLPPNVMSTIPQTGAMWTEMTLNFYWTPYAHSVPFFFGFYIGYIMVMKRKLILRFFNWKLSITGWIITGLLLLVQSYSSFWWVTGLSGYNRTVSTIYYIICSFIWTGSLSWTVLACHHGYGGFINRILSAKIFIVLGKCSYMVYLSHFLILFIFYGNQSLLLEPSQLVMLYVVLGNTVMSGLLGIFLCIVYEIPWLKMHRKLMKYV